MLDNTGQAGTLLRCDTMIHVHAPKLPPHYNPMLHPVCPDTEPTRLSCTRESINMAVEEDKHWPSYVMSCKKFPAIMNIISAHPIL